MSRSPPPSFVACPSYGCGGTNNSAFRFCQWCGRARGTVPDPAGGAMLINEDAVGARKALLVDLIEGKAHSRSKSVEFESFQRFIASRPSVRCRRDSILSAIPEDVVDFLIHRDLSGAGKTVVHLDSCTARLPSGDCGCPRRLAAETMRNIASKIRTRLYEIGCAGAWCAASSSGNPADSRAVDRVLTAVSEEQAKAGCSIVSARQRALLPGKLQLLIGAMSKVADKALTDRRHVDFVRQLQDIAWICVQYRSLNRGAELSGLRCENTIFGPNGCCAVFQFTFSKVLRGGASHEFAVKARPGDMTCPVFRLRLYVRMSARFLKWDWTLGGHFVFSQFDSYGARLLAGVTQGAMGARFSKHLQAHSLGDKEALHGLRAGGALSLALQGQSLADIMLQGFWAQPASARHYVGLLAEVAGEEFVRAVRHHHGDAFVNTALEPTKGPDGPFSFLANQ